MPVKTLDEYLKQAIANTAAKQLSTKPKYRIIGFYKETEFQETSIGKIPKQWNVAKLKEIFEFQRGFSYRKKDINGIPTSIRFITINDMEKEGGRKRDAKPVYLKEELKIDKRFLLMKGDLLIANTDMSKGFIIGAPLYIDDAFIEQGKILVYSMDLTKLIPRISVNTKFFFYLLSWNNIRRIIKGFAQGTNVLHINHDLVRNLNVVIPSLEEQWGIAEVLSTVDRAIEKTEKLIERLERLKKALMQELLTKGIGHKEYKQTSIGKIPKEWKVVKLKDVAKIETHSIIPKPGVKYYYIGLEDIESDSGRILKSKEMLTDGAEIKSTKYIFTTKHVLYGKLRPYLNKVALPPRDGICSTDILPILPNTTLILREYLAYVLRHKRFVIYATARMKGTNHPRVNPKDILIYEFPLPPIEEQQEIVNILMSIDRWIELEKKRKEKLERLKKGLMNLLLTGRIRVKVVRQDVFTTSSR